MFTFSFAIPAFLFTTISAFKLGFFDVMPLIYADNDWMILCQRLVMVVVFAEMMINWFGIRYTDSSFARYIALNGHPRHKVKAKKVGRILDT